MAPRSPFVPASYRPPVAFVVVYRCGGTKRCTWDQTIATSEKKARAWAAEIERGGRKALVKTLEEVREHGLPVGWEA